MNEKPSNNAQLCSKKNQFSVDSYFLHNNQPTVKIYPLFRHLQQHQQKHPFFVPLLQDETLPETKIIKG